MDMVSKDKKKLIKKSKKVQISSSSLNFDELLYQKAVGFETIETVEEFVKNSEGDLELVKRKVNKKQSPPDLNALQILLEKQEDSDDLEKMSLDELKEIRDQIYQNIKNEVKEEIINGNKEPTTKN